MSRHAGRSRAIAATGALIGLLASGAAGSAAAPRLSQAPPQFAGATALQLKGRGMTPPKVAAYAKAQPPNLYLTQLPETGPIGLTGPDPVEGVPACGQLDATLIRTSAGHELRFGRREGATVTIKRRREGGSLATLGVLTVPPDGTTLWAFRDTTINPRSRGVYVLTFTSGTTLLGSCYVAYLELPTSGYSGPLFVKATLSGVVETSAYYEDRLRTTDRWITPAYSADGRLIAAADLDGRITVNSARTLVQRFSVSSATEFYADPAFSPDGQTMAFARYLRDGTPVGLGFVSVFGSHTPRLLSTTVPVVEPAYLADGRIVVSSYDAARGLATMCDTCTSPTPIPGTAEAETPEVERDGTIYYAVHTPTSAGAYASSIHKVVSGTASMMMETTQDYLSRPKTAPAGVQGAGYAQAVHFFQRELLDSDPVPQDSSISSFVDNDYSVSPWFSSGAGSMGFDVSQPLSKGSRDLAGDAVDDVVARDHAGVLWAYPTVNGLIGKRVRIGGGWSGYSTITTGDFTSDDRADLIATDAAGSLWLWTKRPTGGWNSARKIGSGWSRYALVSPGDFDGDDLADLLAVDTAGALWLYPGSGRGSFTARRQVGSGWTTMTAILAAGDVSQDGCADLLARDTAGYMWLYPGRCTGGFGARTRIGSGWNVFTGLISLEPVDGPAVVYGRKADGLLYGYMTTGDGRFDSVGQGGVAGSGWNGYTLIE